MRIGFIQTNPVFGQVEANIQRVWHLARSVSADILVLPELFATGYVFKDRDELEGFAEKAGDGIISRNLMEMSKELDALVVGGFPERDGSEIYNSAMAALPDGSFRIYRKLHLFDREKTMFTPGNLELDVFKFRGAALSMIICFDWIFPEVYRTLAIKGAQIILHPSNLVLPYCQKASFARAVENRVFIVLTNRTGEECRNGISLRFTGNSVIYSPTGEILAQAGEKEECAKVVDINPDLALNKWITQRNHILNDRRPEFYFK